MRTVRPLSLAELETLLGWAADEGWNPGIDDAPAFYATDPNGFLGAFVDDEMVAGISAVGYGEGFGFIGLYIARRDCRGQGHGKAVWDAAMERLDGRVIGLDAVPEQRANYITMGFMPAYETVRLSGRLIGSAADILPAAFSPELLAFDRRGFPAERSAFLERWIAPPRTAILSGADSISGYAVRRACRADPKVGPLFAEDAHAALALLAVLGTSAGTMQIDVPLAQAGFIAALERAGWARSFATTRMYRGGTFGVAPPTVFGITSLELG